MGWAQCHLACGVPSRAAAATSLMTAFGPSGEWCPAAAAVPRVFQEPTPTAAFLGLSPFLLPTAETTLIFLNECKLRSKNT